MWILVALSAPALSAFGNYLDKYLLVRQKQSGGVGTVLIFSSLFSIFVIPFAFFYGDVFSVPFMEAMVLMVNGFLWVGTLAAYLYAIRKDDVVSVMPVLQTAPVFSFIIGYFVLGEVLSAQEVIGSVIVVLCAMFLSLEIEEGFAFRFHWVSFSLAVLSALLYAISGVVFKVFAIDRGYWETQFWEFIGISIAGIMMFLVIEQYRKGFLQVLSQKRFDVVAISFTTETIMAAADLLMNYASLLAPIALVYSVSSVEPAFVLLYAIVASLVAPKFMRRLHFLKKRLGLKFVVIGIMIIGTVLINQM